MRSRLIVQFLAIISLLATPALAQVDVGISGSALVSLQPIDDAYVGSPYLSEGIGGVAPGASVGINAIMPFGLVLGAEYSRAWFEREQYGRLVRGGGFATEGIPATTRLHDSLLSVLIGYSPRAARSLIVVGGVAFKLDRPTIDGVEADAYSEDTDSPVAFTGGFDWMKSLSPRARLLVSGRYTFNERDTRLQYLGIGPHLLRAGVGVRFRLN